VQSVASHQGVSSLAKAEFDQVYSLRIANLKFG
jgi:hypothetical protein